MLKFNGAWRFDSPGELPHGVVIEFSTLIGKMAAQGDRQEVFEHFKHYFAGASGTTSGWSTSASWAETDLDSYMRQAAANAPLFIEAFHDACEALRKVHPELAIPDLGRINRTLLENEAPYEIRPPDLISRNAQEPIIMPEPAASLDEQAQDIIQQSLKDSEELLSEGKHRQAVQETLWLLESVSNRLPRARYGGWNRSGEILQQNS